MKSHLLYVYFRTAHGLCKINERSGLGLVWLALGARDIVGGEVSCRSGVLATKFRDVINLMCLNADSGRYADALNSHTLTHPSLLARIAKCSARCGLLLQAL